MTTSIEQSWAAAIKKASEAGPQRSEYVIVRVDESIDKDLYGGVDADGNLLLAIGLRNIPPFIRIQSSSLDFFRQERRSTSGWLMVFRLLNRELAPVFARLCQDLIDGIRNLKGDAETLVILRQRVALWQKLFADGQSGLLEDFQIKGLIAELLFMESLVKEGVRNPAEIAKAWNGPAGADQDFRFSDVAFEVKAVSPDSSSVCIASIEQLDADGPLSLSIWTLRSASPDEEKAITLNKMVARLEALFIPFPDALSEFRDSLLEVGYLENAHYETVAFEPLCNELFSVGQKFPRLTRSAIAEGISSATYEISLSHIRTLD